MVCVLFGHRDAPSSIRGGLKDVLLDLIDKNESVIFLVGNNGGYDSMAQGVLKEVELERRELNYSIVLSYVDEKPLCGDSGVTLFPEGQELVIKRFAISKRNEWLIRRAETVVCYVRHRFSNSYKLMKKALRSGANVINLADL